MKISRIQIKWVILFFSIGLYISSLFLPAISSPNEGTAMLGYEVLGWGWFAILGFNFAWLANPIYVIEILVYMTANVSKIEKISLVARVLNIIALLLGLTSYRVKDLNRAIGDPSPIALGVGFYVWMCSFIILLIGTLIPSSSDLPTSSNEDAPIS